MRLLMFVAANAATTQAAIALVNATGLALVPSDKDRVRIRVCGTVGYGAGLLVLAAQVVRRTYNPTVAAAVAAMIVVALGALLPSTGPRPVPRGAPGQLGRRAVGIIRRVGLVPMTVAFLVAATSGVYDSYIDLYILNTTVPIAPTAVQALKLLPEIPCLLLLPWLRRTRPGSLLLTGPAAWLATTTLLTMGLATGSTLPLFAAVLLAGANASFETALGWRLHDAIEEATRGEGQAVLVAVLGAGRFVGTLMAWLLTATIGRGGIPWPALWSVATFLAALSLILIAFSIAAIVPPSEVRP